LVSPTLRSEFEARLTSALTSVDLQQYHQQQSPSSGGGSGGGGRSEMLAFPTGLLSVIASHVLQEAAAEPYGVKGCLLHVDYEGQTALHRLATLDGDSSTAAKTFELTLTLRQAQPTWGQRMAR